MTASIRAEHLARAAQIAAASGVEITIEADGRVYRITPARQADAPPIDEFASRSLKR
jgi:hypothetical protein